MGWGHCLKWVFKRLGELVEVIWWCELTRQMLMFVRSSIAANSVFLSAVGKHRIFLCASPLRGLGEMQILFS